MTKLSRRSFLLLPLSLIAFLLPAAPTRAEKHDHHGPKAIYIIRHGEKPDDKDDPHLAPKGVERANALVHVIPDNFVTPDFICSTSQSKHSNRPYETVAPLAKSLGLKILNKYPDADYAKLAHDLLTDSQYEDKNILVCWHHGEIPGLAKSLGVTDAPDKWPSEVFDRVWVLTFDKDGKIQFQNLPQKALPGDSDK